VSGDVAGPLTGPVRGLLASGAGAAVADALRAAGSVLGGADLLAQADVTAEAVLGLGPLAELVAEPGVTDVLVNGPGVVWVDRGRGLVRAGVRFGSPEEVRALAQRAASAAGRRLDSASPCVDVRLPGGVRLHAVLEPPALGGPYVSVRVHTRRPFTLAGMVRAGTMPAGMARRLAALVDARAAFLVTGATGSGKTSLLSTLLGRVDPAERVVLIEEDAELAPDHPHCVRLQARPANAEGAGAIGLSRLVREALRMRPDRIVVGEVRGAELVDLLAALNTGHRGGAGTLHANSVADLPARLEALGLAAGLPSPAVHAQAGAALQAVVHLRGGADGRRVAEVAAVHLGRRGRLVVATAWRCGPDGVRAGPGARRLEALLAGSA